MDDSLLPVTSLRENLTQTHLDFSYFRTTEPKLTPALRKMPFTDLRHTIWTGDACQPQTSIYQEVLDPWAPICAHQTDQMHHAVHPQQS